MYSKPASILRACVLRQVAPNLLAEVAAVCIAIVPVVPVEAQRGLFRSGLEITMPETVSPQTCLIAFLQVLSLCCLLELNLCCSSAVPVHGVFIVDVQITTLTECFFMYMFVQ